MHPGIVRLAAALCVAALFIEPFSTLKLSCANAAQVTDNASAGDAHAEPVELRFNFKGAPFKQVVEYFSRVTTLPVVWETDAPEGTLDYVSPHSYSIDEALRVLNIVLQSRGVMLRVDDDMLYLQKLSEMQKENVPTFVGELPDDVTADQIITVVKPLNIILAKGLAEKLAPLVAEYGSVTPVEQQNVLVITETAGQVRRLLSIVDELDRQDIEGVVEIYKIKHTRASTLLEAIKALLSEKVEKYVINQQGQQVKIEEESMPGLSLSADDRTNSIIAKGSQSKIDKATETIELLDVPASPQMRAMQTFTLQSMSPKQAAQHVNQLFQKREEKDRPAVVAMNDFGKLTVIGDEESVREAAALLREVDGWSDTAASNTARVQVISVVAVRNIQPRTAIDAIKGLLNTHQQATMRFVAGPDGQSIILSGRSIDVEAARALVPIIDLPAEIDRQARMLRLTADDPRGLLDAARNLYNQQSDTSDPNWQVAATLDPNQQVLTLIGSSTALDRFAQSLEMVQQNQVIDRETRQLSIANAKPTALATELATLIKQVLDTDPNRRFVEPQIKAVDMLDMLLITALPEQFETIEALIKTLDKSSSDDFSFRVLAAPAVDADGALKKARFVFEQLARGAEPDELPMPDAVFDAASGSILLSGRSESVQLFEQAMQQAVRLLPPNRDGRLYTLTQASAANIYATLTELISRTQQTGTARSVPDPEIEIIERTNSLFIIAESDQHGLIQQVIRELDRPSTVDLPPLHVLQLRRGRAASLAGMLRQRYDSRATQLKINHPVQIDSDEQTNTLIVAAGEPILTEITAFLERVNTAATAADDVHVRAVFLKHARAQRIAPLVQQVLADTERLTPDQLPTWARIQWMQVQQQNPGDAPLRVSADEQLNAVVVAGPPAVIDIAEQLIGELDVDPEAIAAGPARSVRVLTIRNADAQQLAGNIEAMFAESTTTAQPPVVRVDAASNSLVVRATNEQFESIADLVQQIDAATIATSRQMQLISVDPTRANAAEVARVLEQLLNRSGSTAVEVITLEQLLEKRRSPTSSSLDVDGDAGEAADETKTISWAAPNRFTAMLLTALGALPPRDSTTSQVENAAFQAVNEAQPAPSEDLVPQITQQVIADFDDASDITIAVDEATNSLVVIGSERAVQRLTALAAEIQRQMPAQPGRIRYIPLPAELDVNRLNRMIAQTLSQMTPPGGRRGDLRRRIAIIPDTNANALIISASDNDFETVADLIAVLSRTPAAEPVVVKIYALSTITADRAAESLNQLLQPQQGRNAPQRDLDMTLLRGDDRIEAMFDPGSVFVSADSMTNSLIVTAPPTALSFLDRFIEMVDEAPPNVQSTLKMYPLKHARARELVNTLRNIFRTRFAVMQRQSRGQIQQPEFAADERTNMLIVTAAPEHLAEVDELLESLDRTLGEATHALRMIDLEAAQPSRVAELIDKVVLSADQSRRETTLVVPDDQSGLLLVRASDEVMADIERVLAEIDRDATEQFDVRTITLELADASAVADALQRLYDDRARIASTGQGRRQRGRRVSIIGDSASKTILVAASDDDFEQISELVAQFDSPEAASALDFRVYPLEHARAEDIRQTIEGLVNDLTWNQGPVMFFGFGNRFSSTQQQRGTLAIRSDNRLNALIVTGEGDKFQLGERLIEVLDAPPSAGEQRLVRLYSVQHADVQLVADILREAFTDPSRANRWWEPPDPSEPRIRIDDSSNTIIVSSVQKVQEEIAALIATIDDETAPPDQTMQVLTLQYGRASNLGRTLQRFLDNRADAINAPRSSATIVPSDAGNALIVSANDDDMALLRELMGQLDQPDLSGDRKIEIIALADGDADEIAQILREQFGTRDRQGLRVTPDIRTNSLIINSPKQQLPQVLSLVDRLDTPPASDETIIRTYTLQVARAEEVRRMLSDTLQLDAEGRTDGITIKLDELDSDGVEVKARIVADRRSNSLVITATEQSFPVIEALLTRLDEVPTVSPVEYHIIALEHAIAIDVAFTLRQFIRNMDTDGPRASVDYNRLENQIILAATADQFEQIKRIVKELDVPSERQRVTDFVPLQFAGAEQVQEALSVFYGPFAIEADTPGRINARIVADPATNSLVISADESEWANIRALLEKLDSEEYDSSLQLRVMPLVYADASSVARAINEAFQTTIDRPQRNQPGRQQNRSGDDRRDVEAPTVLVQADEWVRAAAEPQTNSVIISASLQNMRKVEQILEQLDVADYAKLPPPRFIAVTTGSPAQLAESLKLLYERQDRGTGSKALRIVGDESSSTIIVRAEDDEFQQIQALAEALQQQASTQGLTVRVLQLTSAPAGRVASAIEDAFQQKARQANQPLSIQVDSAGNSLIIASSGGLFEEIERTVEQLDALAPAPNQSIFIIELEHVAPEDALEVIRTIGLDQPQPDDAVSRLVTDPIKVAALHGRQAIVVVANPVDRQVVISLLKSLDEEPDLATSELRVVSLRNAEAAALARVLNEVLKPGAQQSQTALAQAVQEQVRRLAVQRDGVDDAAFELDLTKPIRLIADQNLNALIISSTKTNVEALTELVQMFDALPITDAVTIQIFPLGNIAAEQFARIVRDLFTQGKQLQGIPGTSIQGIPGGTLGRALLDNVAISVDERTNTVVVAGKEDAVAFVEVLSKRLDTDIVVGWVEPRIITMKFADSTDLAETLQEIIVEGQRDLPQSTPLQKQVGRLRMARMTDNGGRVIESEVFQPMSRLIIRAEPKLNALILVGTPANIEIVSEMVAMLDVEAASPNSAVRIYPIENASAARIATTVERLFAQQVQSRIIRPEDRIIVQADERTNSLIVSTSPRSFAVLENLLDMLDTDMPPDIQQIRQLDLEFASAARLADIAQEMMDARLERLRRVDPQTAELERATIVAEPRTNSLIIAAGNEAFEVIQQLVTDLDVSTLADDALVEVFEIEKGNIDRIANAVNSIMERRYADMPAELRTSQRPLIMTEPRTNSLLVAANPEDITAIGRLIDKLENTSFNPAVNIHVIALESSKAEAVAPRLQRLMRDRQQSLGQASTPSDRVTIEADTASNSLIVAANEENLQIVMRLIDALSAAEEEGVGEGEFEIMSLAKNRASDVIDMLDELYVNEENRRRGPNTIQITADDRINAVLVRAPQRDVAEIRRLIAQLDGTRPSTVVEIKYIPLTSANALETVGLIETVLSGRGIGTRRGDQATVLKYLRELAERETPGDAGDELNEMEVSAAIRESISLTPDVRTNTIIVRAPRDSMDMIEQMIRDLDESSVGSKNVRIFKLTNADATAMAEIITDLFNLRQGSNLLVLKPREDGGSVSGIGDGGADAGGPLFGTDLTAVPDERQQLSITVDSRTNSLLVSGTPTYLDLVAKVVDELDNIEANERETFVYALRNAAATEVARVITEFVQAEQQKLIDTLSSDQLGSAARLLEREVTIVGDEKSNTVLVSASPRYMERVQQMIEELDVDPPQVLIQVLLAEVTLDYSDEWGVDMTVAGDVGEFSVAGGFGLASAFVSGMGVPSLSVASGDFDLLIKALQSQGRLQVLSNPSVMAANNEAAEIQVGETIRVPESTSFTNDQQFSSVIEEDIGVILNVTPSINPDGFVRMTIQPEISELSNRTIQISEDFQSPIITRRRADTTITVADGQTIVIGGLISDRYELRTRKVPLLGDIPLLGFFFRSDTETSTKTEFLIVLTPYVVDSPSGIDDLTEREVERLSVPSKVKDQIRRSMLEGRLYDAEGNLIPPDKHSFLNGDADPIEVDDDELIDVERAENPDPDSDPDQGDETEDRFEKVVENVRP